MKRELTIGIAAVAILAAGISGCSDKKSNSSGNGASGTTSAASTGGGGPKVTIDGKDQNVAGSVVCTTAGGSVNIAIGGAATGIAAVLTDANPPAVKSVGLGNVNGVTLAYTDGTGQGNASATKSGNTYKISGTATGVDMANPMQPVNKPFEINVTCSS
ncbi:lipoprotein LpqH [Mycobacterium rhizamassiliense]|uniref:lipoprotein LpqH n=1 Tax=Mycobacterium rhizamassiliense TaxID=1841860 RepID=UPI00097DD7CF|nr:lipoprotein LpqH [Mycobacterium rhizamassiliense]